MDSAMRKAFYYNFIPTKSEELDAKSGANSNKKSCCSVVEIRPFSLNLSLKDPNYPWEIENVVTFLEIEKGIILLSTNDTLNHIFQYWSLDTTNFIVAGKTIHVDVLDVTNTKKIWEDVQR